MKKLWILVTALTLVSFTSAQNYQIDAMWVTHLQAEMVEQDAFVEMDGSGMVYRVTTENVDMYRDAPAFATALAAKHDPFNAEAIGPFEKGTALEMTMGDWLKGSGMLTLGCENGQGSVQASFSDLIPNGIYTVWHFYTPMPPTVPFLAIELPLGARDGSQNGFAADANGNALYSVELESCLPLSTSQLMSALAIAYHSDGKTYGMNPGEFGSVSHVQLFTMFPTAEEATTSN